METPVSVIMSVYNGEKYLKEAIDSILGQTYGNFELIIIDDGSTDRSRDIINSYSDRRIRLIVNEANIGLTRSLNRALEHACGEFIARHDSDDVSMPERFERQVAYLKSHPDVAVVGTGAHIIDESGRMTSKLTAAENADSDISNSNTLIHSTVMFRKSVITGLGGYDVTFRYAQDYDLWLRVSKQHRLANISDPLNQYRVHNGSISLSKVDEQLCYDILAKKNWGGTTDQRLLEDIRHNGIKALGSHLNKEERLYYHRTKAFHYVQSGRMGMARREFKHVFKLRPYDFRNICMYILSYPGKNAVNAFYYLARDIKARLKR